MTQGKSKAAWHISMTSAEDLLPSIYIRYIPKLLNYVRAIFRWDLVCWYHHCVITDSFPYTKGIIPNTITSVSNRNCCRGALNQAVMLIWAQMNQLNEQMKLNVHHIKTHLSMWHSQGSQCTSNIFQCILSVCSGIVSGFKLLLMKHKVAYNCQWWIIKKINSIYCTV